MIKKKHITSKMTNKTTSYQMPYKKNLKTIKILIKNKT